MKANNTTTQRGLSDLADEFAEALHDNGHHLNIDLAQLQAMIVNLIGPLKFGYEPETCGTRYLTAERTVRIIERSAANGAIDAQTIEAINELVSEAGVHFARHHIDQMERGMFDDLPF